MNGETLISFSKRVIARINDVRATELSAQLAFYFLLSIFPFLIFMVTLLPYVGITSVEILNLVSDYVPEEAMVLIENNLSRVIDTKKGGLLSFGLLATIWSASNAINALIRALNKTYEVTENRHFIIARGLAIVLTFAMIVVIMIALLLPVFGKMIGELISSYLNLSEGFPVIWELFRWMLSFSIIVVVLSSLYYFAPNKRLSFREVVVGGLVATLGWQLTSFGFSYYVSNFGNYSATYGSIGGVIVLMLWFYLTGFIIIVGGIINAVIHQIKVPNE